MSDNELMNVVTVGGNPVSAFLSWRLQATNACDVTLVWKTGFEHVSQYGISFKYVETRENRLWLSSLDKQSTNVMFTDLLFLVMNASSLAMVCAPPRSLSRGSRCTSC